MSVSGLKAGVSSLPAGLLGALLAGLPQMLNSAGNSGPVLHHQWLTGWSPSHFWQSSFATVDGVQHYPISVGAFYLLRPLVSTQSLAPTLAPFLLPGIVALVWGGGAGSAARAPGVARALLAALLCWWLVPALYLAGVPFESARFTLISAPPLAVLEAVGLAATVRLVRRWATSAPWTRRGPALLATLWAVLSLGILAADARGPLAALARGKDADLAAVRWLDAHAPDGAPIATFGLTLTLYHYGDLPAHRWALLDLSAATPADLARAAASDKLVVVANEGNLATQWRGLPPENALLWLESHARPRRVGQAGGYTIFRPAR